MTSQWDFVIAAYVLTAIMTVGVLWWSWAAMRRSEQKADSLRQDRS